MRPDNIVNQYNSSNNGIQAHNEQQQQQSSNRQLLADSKSANGQLNGATATATAAAATGKDLKQQNGEHCTAAAPAGAKEAKNFHKVLRKPPKGIYLNYDDLIGMAESEGEQEAFQELTSQLYFYKKEASVAAICTQLLGANE